MTRQELKARARDQLGHELFGKAWLNAVWVIFLVTIFTGLASVFSNLFGTGVEVNELGEVVAINTATTGIISILTIVSLIIGGPIKAGSANYFLSQSRNLADTDTNKLFGWFKKDFKGTFAIEFFATIFVALWSLLLVIPGIIKSYAYRMAYYIKNDHPEYDSRKCLKESEQMMMGHKWDLFVQDLSFIGWLIVGTLCLGIGDLWANAYMSATEAQFYRNLTGELKEGNAEVIVDGQIVKTDIEVDGEPVNGAEPEQEIDEPIEENPEGVTNSEE